MEVERAGVEGALARIRERVGDAPLYISVDIDVLDPAHAPGTGTPEAGGLTSRELLGILRGLAGAPLVGADVVEVSPAYDHAEITAVAAAHVCYEMLGLMLLAEPVAGQSGVGAVRGKIIGAWSRTSRRTAAPVTAAIPVITGAYGSQTDGRGRRPPVGRIELLKAIHPGRGQRQA